MMTLANGRLCLALPGPSTMPDRGLQAMHRGPPNVYAGALHDRVDTLWSDVEAVAGPSGHVAPYIGNGHAGGAPNLNLFSRGDRALVLASGHFGIGWANSARAPGIKVARPRLRPLLAPRLQPVHTLLELDPSAQPGRSSGSCSAAPRRTTTSTPGARRST